jgi:hypothetical protein
VNGWKSTQNTGVYELEVGNVADDDSNYIYADAYLTWDGTTGEVSAPGLTDDTLIEYPATNTVNVEL